VLATVLSNAFAGTGGGGRMAGLTVIGLGALLVLIRLASQASYPLAEARRSGAIEMMLLTPLNPNCLITGQLVSLRDQFLPALGLLFIASAFIISFQHGVVEAAGSLILLCVFWGFITLLTATVTAFGMWMGLREKSPNAAFFKTVAFTLLPILLGWCFVTWFALPIAYIVLLAISIDRLTGRTLQRLLRNEKRLAEMTPVGPPPPPVIAPPLIRS
jgi:hypothetical protein